MIVFQNKSPSRLSSFFVVRCQTMHRQVLVPRPVVGNPCLIGDSISRIWSIPVTSATAGRCLIICQDLETFPKTSGFQTRVWVFSFLVLTLVLDSNHNPQITKPSVKPLFCSSDHRAAGAGDAEGSEAAGPGHSSRGPPHPEAQKPDWQVSLATFFINPWVNKWAVTGAKWFSKWGAWSCCRKIHLNYILIFIGLLINKPPSLSPSVSPGSPCSTLSTRSASRTTQSQSS